MEQIFEKVSEGVVFVAPKMQSFTLMKAKNAIMKLNIARILAADVL